MFADTHLMDVTRLTTLGHPLPYIFLAVPFLYFLTLTPSACVFGPLDDLLTSNKSLTTSNNPRFDRRLLLGILAGTFVLLQSNTANMVYISIGLFHSAFARRPL